MFKTWTHLLSNTMGHRHRADPTRLGHQDVALCTLASSHLLLQQEARDPCRFAAPRFTSDHNNPRGTHSRDHALAVRIDRELHAENGVFSFPFLLQVDAELLSLLFRQRPVRPACYGVF